MLQTLENETPDKTGDDVDAAKSADETILETAHERFGRAVEAEKNIRDLAREDLKFSKGDQWPEEVKKSRIEDKRPIITVNRMPQFIHQITNDQRQNRPAIKVSPVDSKADVETAKVLQGMVRHIEYASNADTAYDTAFDSAVRASFGFFRVLTEYESPMSFDQRIRIARIKNRFAAYLDPSYQEPDGSDAKWGFVFDDIPKDEFKRLYPKSKLSTCTDWDEEMRSRPDWVTADMVRIAEYFYFDYTPVKIALVQMPDGSSGTFESDQVPAGAIVIKTRDTQKEVVKWCKLTANQVLEKTDWLGSWIPIIPVLGDELDIDGERFLEGIVRHAKDPARMYNYWKSSETEAIALAPRAPFVGAAGQFRNFEAKWRTAHSKNHPYLEYNPVDVNGTALPAPQRQFGEPAIQAITMAGREAAEDVKATTGIHDPGLGVQSNETSGRAINARKQQSQTSNFHFVDNLSKSIRHCGRIVVDLIPKVYDAARAIRILGEDGQEEVIQINEMFDRNGKQVQYNLGEGKYDVTLDDGPSYQTRRQEAAEAQLELAKVFPAVMQAAPDIMISNMDIPAAKEIAERVKRTMPPELTADDKGEQQIPPQIQAQMQQRDQLIDGLTQRLNEVTDAMETKALELESKERIEMKKLEVQVAIKLAEIDAADARVLLSAKQAEIQDRLNRGLDYQTPFDQNAAEASAGPSEGTASEPMPPQQNTNVGAQVPAGVPE
jgi:hypothetical protein